MSRHHCSPDFLPTSLLTACAVARKAPITWPLPWRCDGRHKKVLFAAGTRSRMSYPFAPAAGSSVQNHDFRTFLHSLYARARGNGNLELSRSGNGVRNAFRRPDGRVVADSSRNWLSTRSMWRATGADGAGFARRYWLSPNSANAWPLQGRIDIVAFRYRSVLIPSSHGSKIKSKSCGSSFFLRRDQAGFVLGKLSNKMSNPKRPAFENREGCRMTYALIWAEWEGHADASIRPHAA